MADPKLTMPVTNITDAPGKRPVHAHIYTCALLPGETVEVPIHLLNKKLRALEAAGIIHIGEDLPDSYLEAKLGSRITKQEAIDREAKRNAVTAPVSSPVDAPQALQVIDQIKVEVKQPKKKSEKAVVPENKDADNPTGI